jgi:hypothetical protein
MFSFLPPFSTTFAGKNYDYSTYGKSLRDIGVTKLAGVAYSVSPSSLEAIHAIFASAATQGVAGCYADYSVPFGAVDFTATALAIKSAGCNGTVAALTDSSNNALAQDETNAGSEIRADARVRAAYLGDADRLETPELGDRGRSPAEEAR